MHRPKKAPSQTPRIWSAWGDWIWSQTQSRYYRQRQSNFGEIETQWGPVYGNDVPRKRGDVEDDIAGALQDTHLDDEGDEEDEDNASYSHQPVSSAQRTVYSKSSKSKDDKKKRDKKGKGKSYHDSEDEDYDTAQAADPSEGARGRAHGDPYARYRKTYSDDDDVEDARYEAAVRASRSSATGQGASGSRADEESHQVGMTAADQSDFISSLEHELDLDPRYRIEPSYKFQPGEIFKVLWPEPAGANTGKVPSLSDKKEIRDNFGGSIFVQFRRFIVVANDSGHCTCVPISTYGGKGCKKRGIKPEKHGAITEKGVKSKRLDGEPKLGFPTVRMQILAEGERLSRESRINYSKIVTVEHNVKVFFIGTIYGEDYEIVVDAVNKCWEQKTFSKKPPKR